MRYNDLTGKLTALRICIAITDFWLDLVPYLIENVLQDLYQLNLVLHVRCQVSASQFPPD